jgi:N-acetylglucosaminyl-diphospho-decaprenol L-rhamnosyltransferase
MDAMDLSIIIVNWNSAQFLKRCLDSVLANATGFEFEIIVIDSGSFDGCDRLIGSNYPGVRFIQSPNNLGFARANNQAVRAACGRLFLFLNPDTEVVGSAIADLCSNIDRLADAGIVGAKLLNSDGTLQTSAVQARPSLLGKLVDCDVLRRLFPRSGVWGVRAMYQESENPVAVGAVSGACLLIKSSIFGEVGGFSEQYFMYAEDVDLAEKVRRAGYQSYYVPTAVVVHAGGTSSEQASDGFSTVMMREATFRFFLRWDGARHAAAFRCGVFLSSVIRLVLLRLVQLVKGRHPRTTASISRWKSNMRWSLKRDGVVQRFYAGAAGADR